MSPEQARGAAVDPRTDIWSLGVTLFEMITGRLPFRGEHEHAVLYSLLNEEPEPLTALRTGVPLELECLVNKAMAKRPEDRYQHVDDLLVDLKAVEKILAATAGSVRAGKTARVAKKNHKRSAIVAASSVIVAGALVLVFWQGGEKRRDRSAQGAGGGKIQSLAVLPFDNLMNDPEQEYFVDGMHDALITGLSKLGSLRVISRTSVMRYRKTEKPMPEIARELDVDVLIEGSVLRVGDEVRITVQLIDGATDEHLWAHGYDRDLRNVLSLLNEVAGAVAVEVDAALTPRQKDRLARARSVDPAAYEALLRGMQLFNTFTLKNVRESIPFFEKAIEIDPKLAEAHAGVAGAYVVLAILSDRPAEDMPKAREAARKALEIDDGLADAHNAAGYVALYFDRDWEAGAEAFRKALEIDPNSSMARHGYADYLVTQGRLDESVEQVLLGRKSNPLSPIANAVVVGHLYIARRYGEVVAEARRLLAIDPKYPGAGVFLREAYWQMGKLEESIEMLRETAWGRDPQFREAMDRGYAQGGPRGVMLALAELLEAKSRSEYVDPQTIARHYAWGGRSDSAMEWMEKAAEARSPLFIHVLLDPAFDSIRDTPRFKELRRRLNLPE
jgi:TolB-like protein